MAVGGSIVGISVKAEYFWPSSSSLERVMSRNTAKITTRTNKIPIMAVGTEPIVSLTLSMNPSDGFSETVSVMLDDEDSPSLSVTVRVNVHWPGSRFVSVYSAPLKSISPVAWPSKSLSIRSLSQSYCRLSLSLAVSREVNPERVMLSPSTNSKTLLELVIAADGGRF